MERIDRMSTRAALAFLSERCHGAYAHLAPDLVGALQHRSSAVVAEAEVRLAELGNPGLRVAWQVYDDPRTPDDLRARLRAFLLRNADWVYQQIFEEFCLRPDPDTVLQRSALWNEPALRNRLRSMGMGAGDPWLARQAQAILSHIEGGETNPVKAAPAAEGAASRP